MSDYGWGPYVPVAERRRKAERAMEKQRKKGQPVAPVVIVGRTITRTFWGQAWCDNLECYSDYANRLPRGRTYLRNGSVLDLQVGPGLVVAQVSGSSIYKVQVRVKPVPASQWRALCADCGGAIASLVELLQGRFSKAVMERLCRQGGLFPQPAEITFSCSCPDGACMCKHVAAVLYGIGARLDAAPEMLFQLRGVDGSDLLVQAASGLAVVATAPVADRVLDGDDLGELFGLEMDAAPHEALAGPPARAKSVRAKANAKQPVRMKAPEVQPCPPPSTRAKPKPKKDSKPKPRSGVLR